MSLNRRLNDALPKLKVNITIKQEEDQRWLLVSYSCASQAYGWERLEN